jgi:hypothetical protein
VISSNSDTEIHANESTNSINDGQIYAERTNLPRPRMKSAFLLTAISSIIGVFGIPSTLNTNVKKSVDVALTHSSRATNQYWICVAVSPTYRTYGIEQEYSESFALALAQSDCTADDCTLTKCVEEGCVAYVAGDTFLQVTESSGYGQNDRSTAENIALSGCRKHTTGCKVVASGCTVVSH